MWIVERGDELMFTPSAVRSPEGFVFPLTPLPSYYPRRSPPSQPLPLYIDKSQTSTLPNHPYALVSPVSHYYSRTTNKITTASDELIDISYNMLLMAEEGVRLKELQMKLSLMFPGAKWAGGCVAPEGEKVFDLSWVRKCQGLREDMRLVLDSFHYVLPLQL